MRTIKAALTFSVRTRESRGYSCAECSSAERVPVSAPQVGPGSIYYCATAGSAPWRAAGRGADGWRWGVGRDQSADRWAVDPTFGPRCRAPIFRRPRIAAQTILAGFLGDRSEQVDYG
ncbi:hypothetical protein MTO96_016782 [Rhipicephalus appendiculatus]